jgi:uncharacterized protein (TIGR03067 family)
MRGFLLIASIFFGGGHTASGSTADKTILGAWTVVSVTRNGKTTNLDGAPDSIRVDFRPTEVSMRFWRWEGSFPFSCNPNTTPHSIEVRNVNNGLVKGIYKVEGGLLTICYNDVPNGKRPPRFEVKPGTSFVILILKRNK